jgi:peptidyl-prolyl cis-trans isomerase B (cyclophilin B)
VSTNQQRREAAKRKLERQQARRAQRYQRRKRAAVITSIVVVVGVVAAAVAITVSRTGAPGPASPNAAGSTSSAAAKPAATECSFPAAQGQPAARPVSPPTDLNPPRQGTVGVTITTNQGVLPITLNRAEAPCTVDSFLHLATSGFYNNTPCHRLVTEDTLKVLQCGDPTGTGTGGPGYTIPDEPPTGLAPGKQGGSVYPRGSIAMAKSSSPNSGGSQFFLVYADSELPPTYTIFGTVAESGIKILDKIAAAGDDGSMDSTAGGGKPKLATTLQTVSVTQP